MTSRYYEIKHAVLYSHDFSGNRFETPSICVKIDDEGLAQQLSQEGWNIRLSKYSTDEEPVYYLPVSISFKNRNYIPEIYYLGQYTKGTLNEDTLYILDDLDIIDADLTINKRIYVDKNTGEERIKAYLSSAIFTIEEKNNYSQRYNDYEPGAIDG